METNTQTNANEGGEKEMTIEEVAKKNFVLWNEALLTGDPKKVAELYSDEATFHATVSGKNRKGQKDAEEYMEHFLKKSPEGKIIEDTVQVLGDNVYLHSGLYNFDLDDGNGGREIVEARFSYVWKKDKDGDWKIIHHHSSVRPSV